MRSTITSRGQTVIPAPIRGWFSCGPSQQLEWVVEDDGSIGVLPIDPPCESFSWDGACWRRGRAFSWPVIWVLLLLDTSALLHKDPEFPVVTGLAQEWLGSSR